MQTRGDKVRRFSPYRVGEHWVHMVAIIVLVVTGLAQRFYYVEASRWVVESLGGIDYVRLIHRYVGASYAALMAVHVLAAALGLSLFRWEPTMLISRKDFRDAVQNIKYYVGAEDRPARCGRYTYQQKLEYWGIVTMAVVMIATGFVLWFPIQATHYLPGEGIPVAKALHSNAAMLIFILVAVWHGYNSIFSPDVFPLDKSIFTGYISRERMRREHPLELDALQGREEDVPAGEGEGFV
ncbi:MAG: cytochrome b/b6 domain-containing protein [Nitrospirota bacterium]|jgi:formate dehydrogenase subunit gamma